LLFCGGCGDSSEPDFASVSGWQHDVGAVQVGCRGQSLRGRERHVFGLEQVFKRNPHGVAEKGHQHMRLGTVFQLVIDGAHRQFAFQRAEGGFGFGELDIALPELLRIGGRQVGAQQVCAFAGLLPAALLRAKFPVQLQMPLLLDDFQFVQVGNLRMARLDRSQAALDLVAVAEFALGHTLGQRR